MLKAVCWFSAGVTSTIATKLALEEGRGKVDFDIIFFETGNHHEDNKRFIRECEEWFGQKIEVIQNDKYEDAYDVFKKQRYINGPAGAPCTSKMKKDMRFELEKDRNYDFQVMGFEFEKKK